MPLLLKVKLEIRSINALASERLFGVFLSINSLTSLLVLKPKIALASSKFNALKVNLSVSKTGKGVKLKSIFIILLNFSIYCKLTFL